MLRGGGLFYRVVNALRRWLKECFYDFEESPKLLARVSSFIDSDVGPCPDAAIAKWVEPLKKIIQEQVQTLMHRDGRSHAYPHSHPSQIHPQRQGHAHACG